MASPAGRYEDGSKMTGKRKPLQTQLRRSISEQLRDSTARAWDRLWKNVRERRLAGRWPQDSGLRGGRRRCGPRRPPRPTVPPQLWAPTQVFRAPRWTGSERPGSPRSVFARAGLGGGCGLRPARADSLAGRCAPGVKPAWGLPGESFLSGRFSWAGPGSAAIHPPYPSE